MLKYPSYYQAEIVSPLEYQGQKGELELRTALMPGSIFSVAGSEDDYRIEKLQRITGTATYIYKIKKCEGYFQEEDKEFLKPKAWAKVKKTSPMKWLQNYSI